MFKRRKVLMLLGPTGVGKSELALNLAKKYGMEIISADSVQVYKDFDIGSAKISKEEMGEIKHYGIDILSPDKVFSACEFVEYTKSKIEEISKKGKLPLIVGGTGLYVKALVEGYNFGDTDRHDDFRAEMEKLSADELYQILKNISPDTSDNIDCKNKVRLIRALEIAKFGSKKESTTQHDYDFLCLALVMPREKLYQKINNRAKIMVEQGLIEETKALYEKYGDDCQPIKAIGYKETLSFLKGEIDFESMLNLISQHTRNYAKRQLTFLKSLSYVKYFDKEDEDCQKKIEKEIEEWMQ